MKETAKIRFLRLFFFAALLAACLASAYAILNFSSSHSLLGHEPPQALATGWRYVSAAGAQEIPSLPAAVHLADSASSEGLTLYRPLPEELPENPTLEFVSRQSTAEVFLDGVLLYSYGKTNKAPVGHLLGNVRHVIPLPPGSQGQELTIRLYCPYSQTTYRLPAVTLGCRDSISQRFIVSNLDLMAYFLFAVFFCLLSLTTAAFFKLKHVDIQGSSLTFFTLFIIISTVWVITDSNILQIMTSDFPVVYFISHIAFMLIPMPLILFLRQTTRYKPEGYGILLLASGLGLFLRLLLFFAGIADLESSLFLTHILMACTTVVCIVLLAREWALLRQKDSLLFLIGFIALALCLLISLLLFIFSNDLDYSLYFRIMLVLMMSAMFYKLFSQFAAMAKKGIETQLYRNLAYTDSLTGMRNRLAFHEQMAAVQAAPDCRMLSILVFDINRLKHTNDTFGHSFGDELICCAARNIRECFDSLGACYRIGGDEFAAILKDCPEPFLKKKLAEFHARVAATALSTGEHLHIAAGCATGSAEGEDFADRLFDQADQAMYKNKAADPS